MPQRAVGRRVHVRLRNGYETRKNEPSGWEATSCRWMLIDDPFDILEYEIL
jgi:hypothetical protein